MVSRDVYSYLTETKYVYYVNVFNYSQLPKFVNEVRE